jgi:hypothetical protein
VDKCEGDDAADEAVEDAVDVNTEMVTGTRLLGCVVDGIIVEPVVIELLLLEMVVLLPLLFGPNNLRETSAHAAAEATFAADCDVAAVVVSAEVVAVVLIVRDV